MDRLGLEFRPIAGRLGGHESFEFRVQATSALEHLLALVGRDWLALYRAGGWGALEARKRGGRERKLDGKAVRWLYNTITMKNPLQMKFEFALWTCDMVRQMIGRKFGIKLSRTSVNRLLKQMGLSAQRPLWRAYQQDPKKVEHCKRSSKRPL